MAQQPKIDSKWESDTELILSSVTQPNKLFPFYSIGHKWVIKPENQVTTGAEWVFHQLSHLPSLSLALSNKYIKLNLKERYQKVILNGSAEDWAQSSVLAG